MHNEKAGRTKGNHKKGTGIYPAAVVSGAVVASDGQVLAQGGIETGNMTSEAAVTKLMWALGQYRTLEEVKSVMQQNLLGEMGNTMNWCE